MSAPKPNLEETLFTAALDLPPAARDTFLCERCQGQPALLASVRALLTLHGTEDDLEDVVHGQLAAELRNPSRLEPLEDLCNSVIGPYRVAERIGAGGTGVVYRARQEEPIRREVALKVIKPGMDTREVLLRFAAERQTLALMDHPGIARVIDAGATERGRPFFVMELVDGEPIDRFCDRHRLDLRARLTLFREVCHAIEHAHRRGVIHRDLKPSNILIGGDATAPRPRIIDFGIAKAMAARAPGDADLTRQSEFIGTPAYMSPEQAAGELDIDTRSDLYSLGAVLHTLLIGAPPLPEEARTLGEIAGLHHRLRDRPPSQPSAAFAQLESTANQACAAARGTTPAILPRLLRGELDWIVQRCLEPDRDRRYATVSELAEELRRHLDDEPVHAVAPSRLYLLGKSVRRHRYAYVTAVATSVALIAATIVSQTQALRASRAEQYAAAEAAASRAVVDFLRKDVLAQASPEAQPDREMKIITALENAAANIGDGRFAEQPLVEADVRLTIADALHDLGAFDSAQPHYQRASQLRDEHTETESRSSLQAREGVFSNLLSMGQYDEAEALIGADYLNGLRRILGERDPLYLEGKVRLGLLRRLQGRFDEALDLLRPASAEFETTQGRLAPDTLRALNELASCLGLMHRYNEAEQLQLDLIARHTEVFGPEHPTTLRSRQSLANNYNRQIRTDEAAALYRDIYEIRRRVQGENHPDTLGTLQNLGSAASRSFRFEEAVAHFRRARDGFVATLGPDNPLSLLALFNLGNALGDMGNLAEANEALRECIERSSRVLGPDHYRTTDAQTVLAQNLAREERFDEAIAMFAHALASRREHFGEKSPRVFVTALLYANLLNDLGRAQEAASLMAPTLAGSLEVNGRFSINTAYMAGELARAQILLGDFSAAIATAEPFLDGLLERYPDRHILALYQYRLAHALAEVGRREEAETMLARAQELQATRESTIPGPDRAAFTAAHAAAEQAIASARGRMTATP